MPTNVLHIILLGPQASGKGTQAKFLSQEFNLVHLETGRILRQMKKEKDALGERIGQIIDQGEMVPSELIEKIVEKKVYSVPVEQGIVFDGTPRRLSEIPSLEKVLKKNGREITHVFFIKISEKEIIKRLSKRYFCRNCGKILVIEGKDQEKDLKCPACQGSLGRRQDDVPEAISKRLALYQEKTLPVLEYYRQQNKLIEINGEQSMSGVLKSIKSFL
ncbi:nucleoside monophosphate kinase [Patescibacteria group bacterium]|nr:nucleoside monophosphate kinase [Patescibacteria group bacterium]